MGRGCRMAGGEGGAARGMAVWLSIAESTPASLSARAHAVVVCGAAQSRRVVSCGAPHLVALWCIALCCVARRGAVRARVRPRSWREGPCIALDGGAAVSRREGGLPATLRALQSPAVALLPLATVARAVRWPRTGVAGQCLSHLLPAWQARAGQQKGT